MDTSVITIQSLDKKLDSKAGISKKKKKEYRRVMTDALLSEGGPFVQGEVSDWSAWLHKGLDDETIKRIRLCTQTGRPCGEKAFLQGFEEKLERLLTPQKPGPKPRREDLVTEDMFS